MELMSLVCYGCESTASDDIFFNAETKRPRIGKCGHSLCDKCFQSDLKCPMCVERFVDDKINYAALGILEFYEETFIERYISWWKGVEDSTRGMCGKCQTPTNKPLRICVECNTSSEISLWKCLWVSKDDKNLIRLSLPSVNHVMLLKSRLWCGDCAIDVREELNASFEKREKTKNDPRTRKSILNTYQCNEGHKAKKLLDITHSANDIKRATSEVMAKFLWKVMEERGKNFHQKCKLRHLRLLRTCEVITHLAQLHYPITSESGAYQPLGKHHTWRWTHRRLESRVSKYFEAQGYEIESDEERVDRLIESFKSQWKELEKATRKCPCTEKWETMKLSKMGNQVEGAFIGMINNIDLEQIVDGCPFEWTTSQKQQERLEKVENYWQSATVFRVFDLPTVFCWNSRSNDVCRIFDGASHKPCVCPRCSNSTCLSCLKSNFSLDCPICNWSFQEAFPKRRRNLSPVYVFDPVTVELVDYYQNNPLKLYENWWRTDLAPGEGYCMNCRSYSTQLELCTYCELAENESALHYDADGDLSFRLPGLLKFPIRWQCSECKPRLLAEWEHSKCENIGNNKYVRGCNHLRNRLTFGCSSMSNCARSVIALKHVKNSECVWKASTWNIVKAILMNACVNSEDVEKLIKSTERFFEIAFNERKSVNSEIEDLIAKLKIASQ